MTDWKKLIAKASQLSPEKQQQLAELVDSHIQEKSPSVIFSFDKDPENDPE